MQERKTILKESKNLQYYKGEIDQKKIDFEIQRELLKDEKGREKNFLEIKKN